MRRLLPHVVLVGLVVLALVAFFGCAKAAYDRAVSTDRCPLCHGEGRVPKLKEVTP